MSKTARWGPDPKLQYNQVRIIQMTKYISTTMPNYANDDDKSLTFRPHFDDKVIKKC